MGRPDGVGGNYIPCKIANHQSQRIALHSNIKRRGAKSDRLVILRGFHVDRFSVRLRKHWPTKRPRGARPGEMRTRIMSSRSAVIRIVTGPA